MKTTLFAAALVAAVAIPTVASANLVLNSSFETYTSALANGSGPGYYTYNAGNAGIANWTVGLTSVDIVTVPYMIQSGSAALDLAGTPGPGSVSQSLATASGTSYVVSFYGLASGLSGTNANVIASLGGTSQTFAMGSTYAKYSFTATATSVSSLVKLSTEMSNNTVGNLLVDNVSVEAVPEPASVAALGLGALGLLRRRAKRA